MVDNKKLLIDDIKTKLTDKNTTYDTDPLTNELIEDSKSDRDLKKKYAKWFMSILILQLSVMNVVFILSGYKILNYSEWSLNLYMSGTLAEVFGGIFIIINNLFPNGK